MLSVDGRCKTLDARANGYARSEGVGALVAAARARARHALCGSAVRQDGRSASLTAPNGSAQRVCSAQHSSARLLGDEVGCIEAHGTGTALGDPTEAGALAAVHGAGHRASLVGAAKASVGHSEASSGQVGLLRVQRAAAGWRAANAQLRVAQPAGGRASARRQARFVLPRRRGALGGELACGVSSFGYSGTIAHAVLAFGSGGDREALAFGRAADASEALAFGSRGAEAAGGGVWARCSGMDAGRSTFERRSRLLLRYRRHAFPWRDAPHPLAQRTLASSDGSIVFRSPAAGQLHAVVADHVVQGRVIFPGAGYLEMARAAAGAALHDVFFLQPLTVESANLLIECAVFDGSFEVRSGEAEAVETALTVHCSGAIDRRRQSLAARRSRTDARALSSSGCWGALRRLRRCWPAVRSRISHAGASVGRCEHRAGAAARTLDARGHAGAPGRPRRRAVHEWCHGVERPGRRDALAICSGRRAAPRRSSGRAVGGTRVA